MLYVFHLLFLSYKQPLFGVLLHGAVGVASRVTCSALRCRGNLHLLDLLNLSHPLRVFLLINERLYRTLTIYAVTLVPTCGIAGLCRVVVPCGLLRLVSLLFLFGTFLDLLLHLL